MAKKDNTKKSVTETTEVVNDNVTVLVNVVRNFKDATDNNRTISSGPNSYYRTNKERADKLVASGFCKYADEELEATKVKPVEEDKSTGTGITDPGDTEEDKSTDTGITDPGDTEEHKPTDSEKTTVSDDDSPNE